MHIIDNKAGVIDNEETLAWLFEKKINEALENKDKISFKIATGFFFIDGFSKYLFDPIKKIYSQGLLGRIQILMGPETKKSTKDALLELEEAIPTDTEEGLAAFLRELYDKELLEFRIYTEKAFHVKLYIFKKGNSIDEVWAGSANLTTGGLEKNIELVVSTGTNNEEKEIYENFFDKLFDRGDTNLNTLKIIDVIKNRIQQKEALIYLDPRTFIARLIKMWDKEYLFDEDSSIDYLYEFEKFSVRVAQNKLQKYGFCLLASSPGLGKTDVSCKIAKYYSERGKILIIIPPILREQWENTLKKNEVLPSRYKIISIGKLQQIDFNLTEEIKQIDNSEFSLIIIDEAHNFRNKNANRTIKLKELLAHRRLGTHLLLVTATPINTSLDNLTSLLNLAQYGEYSTVLNSLGINAIVQALTKKISKNQIGNKEVYTLLKDLLNKVVIRITWSDIPQRFEQDLTRLKFDKFELPKVSSIRYTYDKKIKERIFDQIVPFLEKLNFEYTKLWDGEYFEDKNLIFWYKWRLYKRLESSIAAFLDSINRFKARNEYLLENLDKSNKAETALFDRERLKAIFVAYNGQQQNRKNEIKKRIKSDIDLLNKMINTIEGLRIDDPEVDSKLQKLIKIIKDEGLGRNNPAIIFSESKSTTIYLASKLKNLGLKIKPVFGGELEESEMEEMFGEISKKEINKIKIMEEFERGEYDILITTDILSEGVNLPRANIVINYDIPYNPVKLIQRDGRPLRINAIKKIKIFNFVPEKNIDKELELFKILKERINTIISIFGLDFMIWSLSRLNRKPNLIDLEKLYAEYKEALSTQNPEELNKEIYWGEESEDKVLIQFINKYNISKETVEAQQISKQPIYTVLRSGKHSFFALFEKGQKYTVGELNFGESTEETRKETLTDEEIEQIKRKIEEKLIGLQINILKTKQSQSPMDKNIKRKLLELEVDVNYNPYVYSPNEKKIILKELEKQEKQPPPFRNVDNIKALLKKNSQDYAYSYESPETNIKILAVIKYV